MRRRARRAPRRAPAPTVWTKVQRALIFTLIFLILVVVGTLISAFMYPAFYISSGQTDYYAGAGVELAMVVAVLLYLRFIAQPKKGYARELGLGKGSFSLRNVGLGVLVFLIILVMEIIVGLISQVSGVAIDTNVSQLFLGAPLWYLFGSAVVFPVCEEVLFRGLMVPRFGIVASALVFGILHFSYDSTFGIEIIAAFIFAMIAGYVFKKTKSLYPSIIAHILVNTTTTLLTL